MLYIILFANLVLNNYSRVLIVLEVLLKFMWEKIGITFGN